MKPEVKISAASAAAADGEDGHPGEPRAWLSALADGDTSVVQQACSAWREDEDARRAWHSYHLIGDVMRSEELATSPRRDADFLAGVRARLAAEPVVLAPAAVAPPARRRQLWLVPAATAAGFAAVAGVLVITRFGMPGAGWSDAGAVASSASGPLQTVSMPGTATRVVPQRASRQGFVHDPRVDEYVRAHMATRGSLRPMDPAIPTPVSAKPER